MKITQLIFLLSIIVCLSASVDASFMNAHGDANSKVFNIVEYSSIEGSNLYSEIIVNIGGIDKALVENDSSFELNLQFFEGDKLFPHEIINLGVYHCWGGSGDYKHLSDKCNATINYTLTENNESINILVNLSKVPEYTFSIKITYLIKNFIKTNGDYKIAWLRTSCIGDACLDKNDLERTLILPSVNSVLESWNNFEIIHRIDGKWVLKSTDEESMVWYRDTEAEKKSSISWELSLVLIAIGFTGLFSIMQLHLHKENTWYNVGWTLFALGCLTTGFGGLYSKINLLFVGGALFFIGTIIFLLNWPKEEGKLKKLELLFSNPKLIQGIGAKKN